MIDSGRLRARFVRLVALASLAGTTVASTACNTVPFYEKAAFSDPVMSLEEDATEAHFRQKVIYSREGATGGIGSSAGGGCGCY